MDAKLSKRGISLRKKRYKEALRNTLKIIPNCVINIIDEYIYFPYGTCDMCNDDALIALDFNDLDAGRAFCTVFHHRIRLTTDTFINMFFDKTDMTAEEWLWSRYKKDMFNNNMFLWQSDDVVMCSDACLYLKMNYGLIFHKGYIFHAT